MKICEFYDFKDKKIYKMPDLITDRANASFIISSGKIFGFFGFSYEKNNYANNIEYIDYETKEKWIELSNINLLKHRSNCPVFFVCDFIYFFKNHSPLQK